MASKPGPHRIGLLALSAIADDPRVRRQGEALSSAGYQCLGIGLAGAKSVHPSWPIYTIGPTKVAASRAATRARWIASSLASRVQPSYAAQAYFGLDNRIVQMLDVARAHPCDLWIANDWNTLPVALRLAHEQGARVVYDTHEFATEEYAESRRWRLFNQPFRRALEGSAVHHIDAVTAVSDGIADRLHQLYLLPLRPTVIRNMPRYQEVPFRPTGELIRVLYHGVVSPGRGLEAAIASVAAWHPAVSLSIRGPGDPGYISSLAASAAALGQSHRITLLAPVPMVDLVSAAAEFDVGLFALPDYSSHNAYALPNKLFEYMMAGLALCVSDLPEMARIVTRYGVGRTIAGADPHAIATAINAFDRPLIDASKIRSLEAARTLNWNQESLVFLDCIKTVLSKGPRAT